MQKSYVIGSYRFELLAADHRANSIHTLPNYALYIYDTRNGTEGLRYFLFSQLDSIPRYKTHMATEHLLTQLVDALRADGLMVKDGFTSHVNKTLVTKLRSALNDLNGGGCNLFAVLHSGFSSRVYGSTPTTETRLRVSRRGRGDFIADSVSKIKGVVSWAGVKYVFTFGFNDPKWDLDSFIDGTYLNSVLEAEFASEVVKHYPHLKDQVVFTIDPDWKTKSIDSIFEGLSTSTK